MNEGIPTSAPDQNGVDSAHLASAEKPEVASLRRITQKLIAARPAKIAGRLGQLRAWIRDESTFTDWIIAVFTVVIALAAVLQWREMVGAGRQTDKIIEAANKQVEAANKIREASDRQAQSAGAFAASAEGINKKTDAAVNAFQRMATTSENSLKASIAQAKTSLDESIQQNHTEQRAWVVLHEFRLSQEPEDGKPFQAIVNILNSGKTPALSIDPITNIAVWKNEETLPAFAPKGATLSRGILPPGNTNFQVSTSEMVLTAAQVSAYNDGQTQIYVRVRIEYEDVFKRKHWTNGCVFHSHGAPLEKWSFCKGSNDLDHN